MGDFNYRINGVMGAISHAIKNNMYEVLAFNDQLYIEKKIGRIAWGFEEGTIEFAPTYKLVPHKDLYNLTTRIPGWTDRIIFKSKDGILK